MTLTYITGGIRSGKSEFAEKLAQDQKGAVLYVAFGMESDDEMEERIYNHKKRRPKEWGVLEVPNNLSGHESIYQKYDVILVDCISSWLANKCIMISDKALKDESSKTGILDEVEKWIKEIQKGPQQVIVVSNEVGLGGVALSSLGRFFQDVLGKVNQLLAGHSDTAYAVLSGLPLRLK